MEKMKTRSIIPLLLSLTISFVQVYALPEGTTVVTGGGSASVIGSEMTIQAPDGSIFEHQSFNVTPEETVRFVQPSASARTLNRITGSVPSQIDGRIIANGEVYLLNQSGIIFGESSVVEANKLHAVAGSLSNSNFSSALDQYSTLSESVENAGVIRANEVILGGKTIRNRGSIISKGGVVAIAAGTGLQLARADGSLTVSVTSADAVQVGSASDLAGQALLDSGIIEATKVYLRGNQITQNSDGALYASELNVDGGEANVGTKIQVNSKANRVSNLKIKGSFDTLSVRSSVSMNVESDQEITGTDVNDNLDPDPNFANNSAKRRSNHEDELFMIGAQKVDLRVDVHDLSVQVGFAPIFNASASSLLLAAEGNLNMKQKIGELAYDQILLFGLNLTPSFFASLDPKPLGIDVLKASNLSMDDLSNDLSVNSLMALFVENPSFAQFGDEDMASFSGSIDFDPPGEEQSTPTAPEAPSLTEPSFSSSGLGSAKPGYSPTSVSQPYVANSGNVLSLEQLKIASQYGAFAGRSYFLQAAPKFTEEEIILAEFGKMGGVSSSFGGSFEVVASSASESASDSAGGTNDAGEGESSTEESSSEEGESSGVSSDGGGASIQAARARALGAIPFAPISRPILSPDASALLEDALSPRIEQNLQNYLYR